MSIPAVVLCQLNVASPFALVTPVPVSPWFGPESILKLTDTPATGLPVMLVMCTVTVWLLPMVSVVVVVVKAMPDTPTVPGSEDGLNDCLSSK